MKKIKLQQWLLILLGFFILINFGGFIVELLYGTGLFSTNLAKIRKFSFQSFTLSIGAIAIGTILWIKFFKLKKSSIIWWHAFIGIEILTVLYKIIRPTILVDLIPYYYIIMGSILLFIWWLIYFYLKKLTKRGILKN